SIAVIAGCSDTDEMARLAENGPDTITVVKDDVNTSEWLNLINIATGTSFKPGSAACIDLARHKRFVSVVKDEASGSVLNTQYVVSKDSLHLVTRQLAAVEKVGLMVSRAGKHNGNDANFYRLTAKGWALTGNNSGLIPRLCFVMGQWDISKIQEHKQLTAHSSGSDAYSVSYEQSFIYNDWVTDNIAKEFRIKQYEPQVVPTNIRLVNGPDGFYAEAQNDMPSATWKAIKPTNWVVTGMLQVDTDILNRICHTIKKDYQAVCSGKHLQQNSTVHFVGARGQQVIYKLGYQNEAGDNFLGSGQLEYDDEGKKWRLSRNITIHK
ncbi:MAG: hypothetical protein OQK82_01180, partial [Candidatus Pacearchaeota archaeon]|nr:hypothetical protein [Candidatus Pacearchaeota archaeon]